MSEFKFFDRGKSRAILLIPGWASDYRIFSRLDLPLNYLVPTRFSPFNFEEGLLQSLEKNGLKKISILGWSMGAFLATDLLSHNRDRIDELILVGARKKYEKHGIDKIKMVLEKNKDAFLYKFYNECFSRDEKKAINWFKKTLLRDYLNGFTLDSLLEGLEYLSK
ncbi:MAG: alpha/beta hydrolase, partial [Candidatus Omnitrophica bacterium]|nr:alpha/beta hydrolase [Candidatus Omnitrophota bacterium]